VDYVKHAPSFCKYLDLMMHQSGTNANDGAANAGEKISINGRSEDAWAKASLLAPAIHWNFFVLKPPSKMRARRNTPRRAL
jgi:hypothetical protein